MAPDFELPERPAGNASASEKAIHDLELKEAHKAKQSRPHSSARFVSLILSSIDQPIREKVESDPMYNELTDVLPMDALRVFRLVKEKVICDEFHLPRKRTECEVLCRKLPMRRGESIDSYITRFNETNAFGVKHLQMTPTPELTKLGVFLEAISSQSTLNQFYQLETLKTGAEVASTVVELQTRLRDFTVRMKIQTGKHSAEGAMPHMAGLGLTAQLVGKPPAEPSKRNRSRNNRPTKKTGPIQQGPYDDRLADDLRRQSHFGKQLGESSAHRGRTAVPPQGMTWNGRTSYGIPPSQPAPVRNYAYGKPRSQSSPRFSDTSGTSTRTSTPRPNNSYGRSAPSNNKDHHKRSLFNSGYSGSSESYACLASPGHSFMLEEPIRGGYGTPVDQIAFLPIWFEWFREEEDGVGMTYAQWLGSRILLDTGAEFHVVNKLCPETIANPGDFHEHTGEVVAVKGVVGPAVTMPKVTSYTAVGQTALVMSEAPVSLLSLTTLLLDYTVYASQHGDRFGFCSKASIPCGSRVAHSYDREFFVWIDFLKIDRLFVLIAIRFLTDKEWYDLRTHPDRNAVFRNAPNYQPPTYTERMRTRSMGEVESYLTMQCFTTMSGCYTAVSGEVIDYTDKLQVSKSIGYDHSPLVSKSFLEKARIGEPESIFSKRDIARAEEVKNLKLSLRGISDFQLRKMILNNLIKGCKLTPKDVDNAKTLFGNPDLKGKLTEASPEIMISPLEYMNPKQKCEIYCDIMKLTMTSMFLVGVIWPFNLLIQVPIMSTSTEQLRMAFLLIMGFISAYNHELKVIYFDLESGIRPLEAFFLQRGILLELSNAKTHISRIERFIRTLKERLRTTIQNAVIATPMRFLRFLVESTVRVINYQVDERSGNGFSCPAMLFGLSPMSTDNLFPWMEYGEVPAPLSNVSNSVFRSRTEEALALAPHKSSNGIHVWLLDTKRFAIRDRFFPKPLTDTALAKMIHLEKKDFFEPSNLIDNNIPDLIPINEVGVGGGVADADLGRDEIAEVAAELVNVDDIGGDLDFPDLDVADPNDAGMAIGGDLDIDVADPRALRPAANSKSYEKPWVDPKDAENDIHGDWEKGSGRGRFRYDNAERNVLIPEVVDSFTSTNGVRRSTRLSRPEQRLAMSVEIEKKTTAPKSPFSSQPFGAPGNQPISQMEDAKLAEVKQLIDRDTLDPIMTPPPGSPEFRHISERLLDLFMITKEKTDSRGEHIKFKARYVLNGSVQSAEGYEAKHLSAPTPSDCIIFLMIAIAAYQAWSLSVIDIGGAFLHSYLLARSYVYAKVDKKHVPLVLRVRPEWAQYINSRGEIWTRVQKGLYGLRESPQLWAEHLKKTLINEAGYVQNPKESCVYQRGSGDQTSILVVFVDDILVISKGLEENRRLEKILTEKYEKLVNQTGAKLNYLGMEVLTVPGGFEVTQVGSIEKLLDDYAVVGTRPTPGPQTFLDVDESSPPLSKQAFEMFRSVVMSLLYVARRCRPDIQFHVVWLTSRMHVATVQDLLKLHHLMKYLNGTRKMGLRLVPRDFSSGLIAQIDSSHGIHLSGHGHWGMCIYFYGMCVLCVSRKIKLVTRSSFESEMMGVNSGGVYVLFFLELLETLGIHVNTPVAIMQDNMSAIGIMTGEHKLAMSSKHIALRNLWVMDYAKRAILGFKYLETSRMTPDILGKNLTGHLFRRHRYGMMSWVGTRPGDDTEESFSLV